MPALCKQTTREQVLTTSQSEYTLSQVNPEVPHCRRPLRPGQVCALGADRRQQLNNARRIEADERLQIGEVFQVGEIRVVVVNRPRDIWDRRRSRVSIEV